MTNFLTISNSNNFKSGAVDCIDSAKSDLESSYSLEALAGFINNHFKTGVNSATVSLMKIAAEGLSNTPFKKTAIATEHLDSGLYSVGVSSDHAGLLNQVEISRENSIRSFCLALAKHYSNLDSLATVCSEKFDMLDSLFSIELLSPAKRNIVLNEQLVELLVDLKPITNGGIEIINSLNKVVNESMTSVDTLFANNVAWVRNAIENQQIDVSKYKFNRQLFEDSNEITELPNDKRIGSNAIYFEESNDIYLLYQLYISVHSHGKFKDNDSKNTSNNVVDKTYSWRSITGNTSNDITPVLTPEQIKSLIQQLKSLIESIYITRTNKDKSLYQSNDFIIVADFMASKVNSLNALTERDKLIIELILNTFRMHTHSKQNVYEYLERISTNLLLYIVESIRCY